MQFSQNHFDIQTDRGDLIGLSASRGPKINRRQTNCQPYATKAAGAVVLIDQLIIMITMLLGPGLEYHLVSDPNAIWLAFEPMTYCP